MATVTRPGQVADYAPAVSFAPDPSSGPLERRRAGVLLHLTSLPDGDLGEQAHDFVDFLAASGCTVWQVLPLVPTHTGDGSPYNSLSAMAATPT